MKALLTGSTGFLGGYIIGYFKEIGLDTVTVGRSEGNEVLCDLSVGVPMLNESEQFDLVIHNAGLAHKVRKTEAESKAFFDVNVDGTKNLLEALASRKNKPKCFVQIPTVAVYRLDHGEGINENGELQGN